jgi:hypothetical protein
MSNRTFTILAIGAPLVEVDGTGPTTDRPSGLLVPDGVPTTAPVELLTRPVRRFRVDAAPSVSAHVTITDSPFGAFVGLRRCTRPKLLGINRIVVTDRLRAVLAAERWPRLRTIVKLASPSALALWHLFTDEEVPAASACTWQDVGDDNTNQVTAQGGDLVVVTFVVP